MAAKPWQTSTTMMVVALSALMLGTVLGAGHLGIRELDTPSLDLDAPRSQVAQAAPEPLRLDWPGLTEPLREALTGRLAPPALAAAEPAVAAADAVAEGDPGPGLEPGPVLVTAPADFGLGLDIDVVEPQPVTAPLSPSTEPGPGLVVPADPPSAEDPPAPTGPETPDTGVAGSPTSPPGQSGREEPSGQGSRPSPRDDSQHDDTQIADAGGKGSGAPGRTTAKAPADSSAGVAGQGAGGQTGPKGQGHASASPGKGGKGKGQQAGGAQKAPDEPRGRSGDRPEAPGQGVAAQRSRARKTSR